MKKIIPSLILLIISSIFLKLNAQTLKIDSLENLLQQHTKQDTIKVNLLTEIGNYLCVVDIDKTLIYAEEAGILADNLNFENGKAESLLLTGTYYRYKSDYPKALEYCQMALEINKKIKNNTGIAYCLRNIGVINWKQGNNSEALEYYQKAIQIFENLSNKQGISSTLNNIGIILRIQGNYPPALEHFQKALKINTELGDTKGIASVQTSIGNVYWKLGDNPLALEYYENALKINRDIGDKQSTTINLINIGNIFWKQDSLSVALEYYQNALEIAEEIENRRVISYCLNNIGFIYRKQGKYSQTLEYYHRGLKIMEEIGVKTGMCEIYSNIVQVYLKTNNYYKALDYANKSLEIANKNGLLDNQKMIYEQLSEIYAALKIYEKAYENHVLFKEFNDSIFNENNIKKITNLENQYEFDKEKQSIELKQQKKDAISFEKAKRQKIARNSFIGGFILMLILALVVLRSFLQKRNANRILASQKKEIEDQNGLIKINTKMIIQFEHDKHKLEIVNNKKDLELLNLNNQLKIKMKNDLIEDLQNIKKCKTDKDSSIQSVINKLKHQVDEEAKIDLLQNNINEIGSDFNERIKQQFPDLSKSEIELLSFIKLKLSNKQIAIQRNTSPNTINVAMHRLKLKYNFDSTTDLKIYIEEF